MKKLFTLLLSTLSLFLSTKQVASFSANALSLIPIGRRAALVTPLLWTASAANALAAGNNKMNSSSKLIVITGATRGIGSALMLEFTRLGHTVFGCGSSAKSVDAFLERHPSVHAKYMAVVDVRDSDQVESWAQSVMKKAGAPNILINGAGVIHDNALFTDIPRQDFDRVIDVNIKGTANVIRSFLPHMLNRKEGLIVNLTSGAGLRGIPEISGYCTSKFGVEGLSQSIAKKLPDGIAIVPLQPGVVNTDMLQKHFGGERADTYPTAAEWAEFGAAYILELGPNDNGQSLRIPDPPKVE